MVVYWRQWFSENRGLGYVRRNDPMKLGKVVKSNSHCDYWVQVDDRLDVEPPPDPDRYGFGSFVRFMPKVAHGWAGVVADRDDRAELSGNRPQAVGIVYNSQLFNPQFLSTGPRLASDADALFTPDLIAESRTLLNVVLIGELISPAHGGNYGHGRQGIPRTIVPINAQVYTMEPQEIDQFHRDDRGESQFRYHSVLLRYGGSFANHLTEQVLQELVDLQIFKDTQQRALTTLCREMVWRNTLGSLR